MTFFDTGFAFAPGGAPDVFSQILTNTADFTNAAWTKSAGLTATGNTTVGPFGTTTADTITGTTTATKSIRQSVTLAVSTAYTLSCYMKVGTSLKVRLQLLDGAWAAYVDIAWTAGVPSTLASALVSGITYTAIGSGWYRVSFQATTQSSLSAPSFQIFPDRDAASRTVILEGANLTNTTAVKTYRAG